MAYDTIRTHKGAHNDLTADYVRSLLDYDPKTGDLRWSASLTKVIGKAYPGAIAGWKQPNGRRKLAINGIEYMAHRIIWLMMTDEWPQYEIDHRDLNKGNNCWANLRHATPSQNQSNRPLRSNNKSGFTGVCFDNRSSDWLAYINKRHIGHFKTLEEAVQARTEAVQRVHKDFAHAEISQNLP